ncbi:MAG TPA: fused MFS/spermidine synthase [Burkholderiaceae bacterium]|nr:fused MFS/spermidine synthase [Burkholderiaceae bacterium]
MLTVAARAATAALAFVLAACLSLPPGERLVHAEQSAYQTLIVTDSPTHRCLRFDDANSALNQSCQQFSEPDHLVFDYTRAMAALLLLWQPPPQRVLLIGVGGGSIPNALARARPQIEIDAVDIDAVVVQVAQRYFRLVATPQLRLHVADGREFVAAARSRGEHYDAVLLDAFDAHGIPPALFSEEFLRDVRAVLTPDGVFLANTLAGSVSHEKETRAATAVFSRIYSVQLAASGGNRLIVAARDAQRLPTVQRLMSGLPEQASAMARIGIDGSWVDHLKFTSY